MLRIHMSSEWKDGYHYVPIDNRSPACETAGNKIDSAVANHVIPAHACLKPVIHVARIGTDFR